MLELSIKLFWCTEDMRIVLSKAAHTSESMQFPTLLVAVYGTELGKALRQVLIAPWVRVIDLTVVRTVHRFEQIFLTFVRSSYWLETILTIFLPVA